MSSTETRTRPSSPARAASMPPLWLLALTLAAFATGTDDMVIAGLLPWISHDLTVTEAVAGQLVTGYALVYALGAPLLAVLTARLPRRRLLIGSTLTFAGVNLLMAVAPSYAMLFVLRLVAAGLAAVIVPTALSMVASLAPDERRGRWLSTVTAGITLALIAGVPLGAWIAVVLDWRATMVFVAVLAAIAALGMTRLRPIPTERAASLCARLAPLTRPAIWAPSAAMVVAGAGGMMGYIYLAPMFAQLGVGPELIALVILVYGLAGFGGVLLGGRGADSLGSLRTLILGSGVATVMIIVLAILAATGTAVPLPVLLVITAVWAVGLWSFSPPMQTWLLSRAQGMDGAVLALNTSGMYLGFALAGLIGGVVLSVGGSALLPAGSAVLLATGGVLMAASIVWIDRRDGGWVRKGESPCRSVNWRN
ncbi:MFS transporter [Propionibacteriaceae bacterium Y1685]